MGRRLRLPAALRKSGGTWPPRWGSSGLERAVQADKAEESLKHLAKTPQGAFWADLEYGTRFHIILTQGLPFEGGGGGGPMPESLEAANTEFISAAEAYVPDAEIFDTTIEPIPNEKSVVFRHNWTYHGDNLSGSGGAKPRTATTVI